MRLRWLSGIFRRTEYIVHPIMVEFDSAELLRRLPLPRELVSMQLGSRADIWITHCLDDKTWGLNELVEEPSHVAIADDLPDEIGFTMALRPSNLTLSLCHFRWKFHYLGVSSKTADFPWFHLRDSLLAKHNYSDPRLDELCSL